MEWWMLAAGLVIGFCGGWVYHPSEAEVLQGWLHRYTILRHEEYERYPSGSRVAAQERALQRLVEEMREASKC